MKRIKRAAMCVMLAVMLAVGSFAAYGEDSPEKVVAARNAVVRILVEMPGEGIATGSGFGIGRTGEDAETFVTNWHVVTSSKGTYDQCKVYILLDDETYIEYKWVQVKEGEPVDETSESYARTDDGTWYRKEGRYHLGSAVECEVLYAEHQYPDVAIIKAKEPIRGVTTLPLKQVGQESILKKVYTIGYPASADTMTTQTENPGTTSAVERKTVVGSANTSSPDGGEISRIITLESAGNTVGIVHHAHINHGNSGGPLVMEDGSAIGINTYGYGDVSMEYSVSIDIKYAMDVLDQLGIEYTKAGESEPDPKPFPIVPAAAAAAAAVIVIIAAASRKKTPSSGAGQSQGAAGRESGGAAAQAAAASVPSAPAVPTPEPASQQMPVASADSRGSGGSAGAGQPFGGTASLADLRLQGIVGIFAGRRFAMTEQLIIGRDGNRCSLVYPAGTKGISGAHCVISCQGGRLTVTDLGSTYGTAVNGRKLTPNMPCPVSVGDRIFLGSDNEGFQITRKGGAV